MSDTYTWQLVGAGGSPLAGRSSAFPTQAEAEAWLGEEWALLLEDGVEAVVLLHGSEPVYGPMSLREGQ